MGPDGERSTALSWLLRVGLWKETVVFEAEGLRGETYSNSGGCGSLLICSTTLCKGHSFAAHSMMLKLFLTLPELI